MKVVRCTKCGCKVPIGTTVCYRCMEREYEDEAQLQSIREFKRKQQARRERFDSFVQKLSFIK